jgi:hypothetical protein
MSHLNLNRNIFLEKEELVRFQEFLANGAAQVMFLKNTVDFGIVLSDFISDGDFKIEAGSNSGTIKLVLDSYAFDSDGLLIHQVAFDNLAVTVSADPGNPTYYWVKISHQYDPTEVGTLSISTAGVLSGTNTLFQDVLRGGSTDVPVKIKFLEIDGTAPSNDQVYEVSNVINDTNAIVTGGSFSAESNLKYVVVGSTPINENITSSQLEGLYQYDSCLIEFIPEEYADTLPVINYTEDEEFYIARVKNVAGTVTVTDKREKWWTFNIPGLADKLAIASNLSDLANVATARTNLNVYSKTETAALIASTTVSTTSYESKHAGVDSLAILGLYNNFQATLTGQLIKTSGSIPDDELLFKVRIPSFITAAPLAWFYVTQPGTSYSNASIGIVKIIKNGDYVEARTSGTFFDTGGATIGFNVTWLI